MSITVERKQDLLKEYAIKDGDTGSPEVQVAILTERINNLTEHLKSHKKDFLTKSFIKLICFQLWRASQVAKFRPIEQ